MDQIDKKILEILQHNSRATSSDISKEVSLSLPAVSDRIRKLEEAGVIVQYTLKIDRPACDFHLLALIFVSIGGTEFIENFRKTVVAFPQVLECHHMAGDYDYLLKVLVRDTTELEDFLSRQLKGIEGVQKTNTQIVLSTLKEEINRPVLNNGL
jgi:Lrp/AsnC family leucine-responsive transcriptional regulator